MIIIEVSFVKDSDKTYQYLLLNPDNHQIDKSMPLYVAKGATYKGLVGTYLYIHKLQRTKELPAVVTKQIIVLNGSNEIRIEELGLIPRTPHESVPVPAPKPTPKPAPKKEEKSSPPEAPSPKVEEIKTSSLEEAFYNMFKRYSSRSCKQIYKDIEKSKKYLTKKGL